MAHERAWSLYFNDRDMGDNVVNVDFNLISHLQQQLLLCTNSSDDHLHRCLWIKYVATVK